MKTSFMSRLSLGVVSGVILFAVMLTFMTGMVTAANNIALAYLPPGTLAPFPQPYYELLLSFAVAFIPISIVVWDHKKGTEDISFMEKLTLAVMVGIILFGVMLTFMTGIVTATNGIAVAYGAAAPFPQPWYEMLVSFAVAMIPLANEIWKHNLEDETEAPAKPPPPR